MKLKEWQKLLAGLALGAILGVLFHEQAHTEIIQNLTKNVLDPLGQIFLRLIFMVVVPLVFSGLVLGVYQLSQHEGLGRVVQKTLLYTFLASAASVVIGISIVNILRPGDGVQIPQDVLAQQQQSVSKIQENAHSAKSFTQTLVDIIPRNPIDSAARALDGEMIALMFFALIFGIGLAKTLRRDTNHTIISVFEQIYEGSMAVVDMAMKLAPYAVFALVFSTTSKFGFDLLISLAFYVLCVVSGLLLQQFGVYALLLKSFTKMKPLEFFKKCRRFISMRLRPRRRTPLFREH